MRLSLVLFVIPALLLGGCGSSDTTTPKNSMVTQAPVVETPPAETEFVDTPTTTVEAAAPAELTFSDAFKEKSLWVSPPCAATEAGKSAIEGLSTTVAWNNSGKPDLSLTCEGANFALRNKNGELVLFGPTFEEAIKQVEGRAVVQQEVPNGEDQKALADVPQYGPNDYRSLVNSETLPFDKITLAELNAYWRINERVPQLVATLVTKGDGQHSLEEVQRTAAFVVRRILMNELYETVWNAAHPWERYMHLESVGKLPPGKYILGMQLASSGGKMAPLTSAGRAGTTDFIPSETIESDGLSAYDIPYAELENALAAELKKELGYNPRLQP
ncbi:MAG TPA: hypothetical protein VLA04_04135 [Verrucomicrobiae bacterium]|nr:hypothetical protein [Verrucomicrobiae bacterium]